MTGRALVSTGALLLSCVRPLRGMLTVKGRRRDEDAKQIAHGLIQGYIGRITGSWTCRAFHGALVQALQAAHEQGWKDRADAEKLTRH
jgi:hypothetical protein